MATSLPFTLLFGFFGKGKIPLLFFPFLFLQFPGTAQQIEIIPADFQFEKLPPGHELANKTVMAFVEDGQGMFWMGTGSGLARFDGYHYKWFKNNPTDSTSLCNNWVKAVLKDQTEAVLWLGTTSGFSRFDLLKETFKNYPLIPEEDGKLSPVVILSLSQDSSGNIWISTVGSGLICFNPASGTFTGYRRQPGNPNSLSADFVGTTFHGRSGRIWINTNRGIDILEPATGQFQHIDARRVIQDADGRMWIFGRDLLRCFDPLSEEWSVVPESEKLTPYIACMQKTFIDNRDRMWIDSHNHLWSAENNALARFDLNQNKLWVYPYDPEDPESVFFGNTWCVYEDSKGSFWFGNMPGGYYRLDAQQKKIIHIPVYAEGTPGSKALEIHNIAPSANGQLWLNAGRERLLRFDPDSGNSYPAKINQKEFQRIARKEFIWSMAEDQNGFLWIGSFFGGAYRYNPSTGKITRFQHIGDNPMLNVKDAAVYAVYLDRSGRIWFGYNVDGIAVLLPDEGRLKEVSVRPGLTKPVEIRQFWEDGQGMVWAGTKSGDLLKIDPHDFRVVNFYPFSVGSNRVASFDETGNFLREGDQRIWFSTTNGGLYRIDLDGENPVAFKNWRSYNSNMPTDELYTFVQDHNGKFWIASAFGLICFDPQQEEVIRFFSNRELKTPGLGQKSWKDKSGRLFFSSAKGLLAFYPDSIHNNPYPPEVAFTDFSLFNKSLPIQGTASDTLSFLSPLRRTIRFTEKLELEHWQNDFSIEFTALNYSNAYKNQFAYQLIGYDKNWIYSDSEDRVADYTNLDPGRYTFRVKASNNDGVWNEEGAAISIRIYPPWWRTTWATLLWAALAFGGIYSIYRFQLNRQIAEAENRRLQELDALKTRLYTNITHEFRTPLTIMLGMADQLKNQASEHAKEGLQLIKRNGKQLLRLVNQMLDLSKLEAGSLELNYEQGDIINYLQYLVESFHSYAESKRIRLHFLSEIPSFYMDFDPVRLMHVLSNLLSNAIKFSPEGKDVYISVAPAEPSDTAPRLLQIKVKDTGIGIPREKLPYIFDRFYQADDSSTRKAEGAGIGLTLAQELVKLMKGEITVKSEPGKGSVFTVILPATQLCEIRSASPEKEFAPEPAASTQIEITPLPLEKKAEKPVILIVEDNADMVRFLVNSFNPAYRLEVAYNGQQGIDKALALIPDIIITDVMMPEKDGYELCRELKNHELTSHIPIIMLTARVDAESRLTGFRRGADAYLEKPFLQEELEVRIKALLEQRQKLQAYYRRRAGIAEEKESLIPSETDAAPEHEFLMRVNEVLKANLDNNQFTVDQLSKALFVHPSNLYRKLMALTGENPNHYIHSFRLARAKELLSDPSNTIATVAFETGFSSPEYFTRVFKKEVGMTPSQYRER